MITPYLDCELFDFLSGLPAEMFLDHAFHSEAIRLAYPQYDAHPFSSPTPGPYRAGDRAMARKFASDVIMAALRFGRTTLVRREYFLPRLFRCVVDRNTALSVNWLGPSILYLLELERAALSARDAKWYWHFLRQSGHCFAWITARS